MGSREEKTHLENDREEDEIEAEKEKSRSQRMDGWIDGGVWGRGYNPDDRSHVALTGEGNSVSL